MKKDFKIQIIAKKENSEVKKNLNLRENFFNTLTEHFLNRKFDSLEISIVQNSTRQHIEKVLMFFDLIFDTLDFLDNGSKIDLMLLISESLSNAVYHGNLKMPKNYRKEKTIIEFEKKVAKTNPELFDKEIFIECVINREKFFFKIKDSGEGFDYQKELSRNGPPSPAKEHGRGIFIIKKSADSVNFSDMGRELTIIKYIGG